MSTTRIWLGIAALVVAAAACGGDSTTEPAASTPTGPTTTTEIAVTDTSEPGSSEPTSSPSSPWEVVDGDGYTGVISHGALDQWGPTVSSQKEWTISPVEVAALEKALPDGLREAGEKAIVPKLSQYTRWYVGVFRAPDRRRQIHASYACRRDDDWLERVPIVSDGGNCYFTVVYDDESGTFEQIVVNGES